MDTRELAGLFEALASGLGAALKEGGRKELLALAELFRRFPGQGVGEFVKAVVAALEKEAGSGPALAERCRASREGRGEPAEKVLADVARLKAPDLKRLVKDLGLTGGGRKDDNERAVGAYLRPERASGPDRTPDADGGEGEAVGQAVARYEELKGRLAKLTLEAIRAEFAAGFSELAKGELAGVLGRQGYPTDGTRADLYDQLLQNLISIKMTHEHMSQIGPREAPQE